MLTDLKIRAARGRDKPYKLTAGEGLYLLVKPNHSRLWRFRYSFAGKEKLIGLGAYEPGSANHVSLAEAKERQREAKALLRTGTDPSAARQAQKQSRLDQVRNTFEAIAREWHTKQSSRWTPKQVAKELRQLTLHVLPEIGSRQISELRATDLLSVLQKIEDRGRGETAHRVRRSIGAVCRYAVLTHRLEHDISSPLQSTLKPVTSRPYASITDPKQVGTLLRTIQSYDGSAATRYALLMAPHVFVRPGELRAARWEEFTFDLTDEDARLDADRPPPEWRIPAERMKMKQQHIVPLSRQVVGLLRELNRHTGPAGFLFPSPRTNSRCISENTINAALRRLDYSIDEMTGHGFRHMASTLLHERGYQSEWIERQLAHSDRNPIRSRYNFAEYLAQRRAMMQEWSDYLDKLRDAVASNIVQIRAA